MPTPTAHNAIHRVDRVFEEALATLAPLAPGARLLLGCSAGGDSMALLELAARHAPARGWALAVAHLDHAQRPESAAEAQFVAARAVALGLPAFIERLRIAPAGDAPLTEEVMRHARHAAFRRAAHAWETRVVLLAHQADDQAETLLIRLLAGSGPTGLGAIRPVEEVEGLTLARPLLAARRADLRAWLAAHELSWRDDPTNDAVGGKRGWVRNSLLPLVREKIGLDPAGRLGRAAALIREESEALEQAVDLMLGQLALEAPAPAMARLSLAHPLWRGAGPLLRRQILRQWLWGLRRRPHPPGYEAIAEALAFVESARPGAELRTVERLHVVHLKSSLLAFAPETGAPERRATAAPLLPVHPSKTKSKKPNTSLQ